MKQKTIISKNKLDEMINFLCVLFGLEVSTQMQHNLFLNWWYIYGLLMFISAYPLMFADKLLCETTAEVKSGGYILTAI